MHRVVPELIVENYRAGHYRGEFPAVGMFLDLSGFSKMTDTLMQRGQHGAEVLAGLMHGVFDPLVENIFAHGGRIVSFAGDGIMALFPIEDGEKNVAQHALASAWMIQSMLLNNPDRQTVYGNFHFSIKIGIAIGQVAWGILRSRDGAQATYYFRGPVVEESARAEHAARAGQIVLTNDYYNLLRDEITVQPDGSFYRLVGLGLDLPDPASILFPTVDVEVTRIFMPEEVITQNIAGEFRQIVNLFMRIPNLSYDELQAFSLVLFELRDKYGGLINRVDFGDKGCNLLMLWGAPVAYENDIRRALDFILDLRERIKFPVTAGVTYYVAHAGYLGGTMYEDYTCYGWGVNLASRFMMNARDGSIWIDERVARRVKNRFEYEFLGTQRFKGFAAEQKVYELIGRKQQDVSYQGEFVGREVELPRLADCLQPIWQGRFGGVTVIWGDAGSGKSRLLYELNLLIAYSGWTFLWAPCPADQILRDSFNPFRYWLSHYFGISSKMTEMEQKQAFDEKLDDLIGGTRDAELAEDLSKLRSFLGALIDLHWSDSFYEQLDAENRYNNTLKALTALIQAESLRQPVILVLEDAHFLDEDSKAFLPKLKLWLSSGSASYPVALLVSSRPVGADAFLKDDWVDNSIELRALSLQALSALAEVYLGGVASPDLVHILKARAEGNPYFAEQILLYLREENLLEYGEKGWRVTRRLHETSLPTDIRAVLVARLDQLPRNVRDVIQTAAVLGREFEMEILAAMWNDNADIDLEVGSAEQANVWILSAPGRYMFVHALLRDAAYTMQTRARRSSLHAQAVSVFETLYSEEIHPHYGRLAYHSERARLPEKALTYLSLAGRAAADAYQNAQAVDYFTRALAFVPPDDLAAQYDLLAERVEMYARMGARDQQASDLSALERWSTGLDDKDRIAKTRMLQAAYDFATGNYPQAIESARQAGEHTGPITVTELALFTRVVAVTALLRLGRLSEAMQRAGEALEHCRLAGNRKEEGRVLTVMGLIALEQKEPASARSFLVDALDIARETRDLGLENRALTNLAMFEGSVEGNYSLAREYYEQAYKLAREIGDRTSETTALGNLGFVAGMQGDFESARLYHEQALGLSREIGNLYQVAITLVNLSATSGVQNEPDHAIRYAEEAFAQAEKTSERSLMAWALLYLGHAHLLKGEVQQAQESYTRSLQIRIELDQPALSMEPLAGLVETYLRSDNLDAALQEAEKILAFMDGGSTLEGTEEPLRVYHACYQALKKKRDPRARHVLQDAAGLLEAQVSKFRTEAERNRYVENIPWRRAIRDAAWAT